MKKSGLRALAFFSLVLLCSPQPMLAQNSKTRSSQIEEKSTNYFRGVVVDELNEPLPGVSVIVKGKQGIGAATNLNGEFSIAYSSSPCILQFSYVGMKTQEVRAVAGKRLTVRLEPSENMLKETVVNGIYTRNIESFTGSVSTFDKEQLKTVAAQGILKSLAILDPSVIITDNNLMGSDPNTMADISINGKMNVTALAQEYETDPNQPLFILDGFETTLSTINDLNMDRVESISILKDASATAIYGSKAANGVIVVETRKPTAGRLRVNYNGSFQVAWADLSDYNLMNAAQKLEYERLSGVYGSLDENGLPITESNRTSYYDRLRLVEEGHDTYWMNEPLRTALTQNHNVYLEGGDSAFRYGAGLSYGNTEGVMKNSDRQVVNGNITLSYRVDNLSFTNQLTNSTTNSDNETVAFSQFSQMNPFYDKRTEDGDIPKYVYNDGNKTIWNPLWDFNQNSYSKGENSAITDNFQFEWTAMRNLRLRGNFQYSSTKTSSEKYVSPNETSQVSLDVTKRGSFTYSSSNSKSYSGRLNATYGLVIKKNTINAVAGMQFSENSNKSYSFMAQGYLNDKYSNPNFSVGYPDGGRPTSSDSKSRSVSYYGNFNYSYDMRYLLDLNYTKSGASQFGIDDPFTTTWSVGAGWNVHNEKFFHKSDLIEYLKLRFSYGNPGNQNYDAKLSSSIYGYTTNYTNLFGLSALVSTWGNNGLKWQKTKTYNWGLTATMFKQRLSFTFDYQIRKNDPLLVSISLPASTGVSSSPMNIGATENKSISLSATVHVIKQRDLNWNISGNLSHYTTVYRKIGDLLEQYNEAGRANSTLLRMYDGASTTALYVVRSLGIDPTSGNEIFLTKDGQYTYTWSSDDEVLYGDSNPDVTGSFSTSLVYKGFSLGASFSYNFGGDVQLSTLMDKVENISSDKRLYNQDVRALKDRWKQPGDIAKYKRIDDTGTTYMSSRFIATENTVKCSSINVGYRTTTAPFLAKVGATSLDLRAYMNDIFRISNIKEERGTSYPFQRSVTFSVGFGF